jgi:hypothetical protein
VTRTAADRGPDSGVERGSHMRAGPTRHKPDPQQPDQPVGVRHHGRPARKRSVLSARVVVGNLLIADVTRNHSGQGQSELTTTAHPPAATSPGSRPGGL